MQQQNFLYRFCFVLFASAFADNSFSQSDKNNPDIIWYAETTYDINVNYNNGDNNINFGINYFYHISSPSTNSPYTLRPLIDYFYDAAYNGTHTMYGTDAVGIARFDETLSADKFKSCVNRIVNDSASGTKSISKNSFKALKVSQEWYYDREKKIF